MALSIENRLGSFVEPMRKDLNPRVLGRRCVVRKPGISHTCVRQPSLPDRRRGLGQLAAARPGSQSRNVRALTKPKARQGWPAKSGRAVADLCSGGWLLVLQRLSTQNGPCFEEAFDGCCAQPHVRGGNQNRSSELHGLVGGW